METLGQPEDIASSEETPSDRERVLRLIEKFEQRPDQPKYSYKDQYLLAKESARTAAIFQKEKTESAEVESKEAEKKFLESKEDKKHINAISTPLVAALDYLESEESESILKEKRKELIDKIKDLYADLGIASEEENISDELISKTLGVMGEIKICLQQTL